MNSTAPKADRLEVAIHQDTALVRVLGRGSFKISTALKAFAVQALEAGCRQWIFDMNECVGMDSTFMGVVAGLALRLGAARKGRIVMVNMNPKTRGLLTTLGLDEVVETHLAGSLPDNLKPYFQEGRRPLTALPTGECSQRETAQTMLEAHENLVRLSPENLPRFKDVLTFLREDIKKSGTAPVGGGGPAPPGQGPSGTP